jgi:hypothetical protein
MADTQSTCYAENGSSSSGDNHCIDAAVVEASINGVISRSKTSSNPPPVVEKPQSSLRWIMLVIFCLTMITNYYCYDIPAALKTQV